MFKQTIAALAVFLCGACCWLPGTAMMRETTTASAIQATQLLLTELPIGERRAVMAASKGARGRFEI